MDHQPVLVLSHHAHLTADRDGRHHLAWSRPRGHAPRGHAPRPQHTHLSLHLPAGDGGLPVVSGFELQDDGARADVGNGQVGGGSGELWGGGQRTDTEGIFYCPSLENRRSQRPRVAAGETTTKLHKCCFLCVNRLKLRLHLPTHPPHTPPPQIVFMWGYLSRMKCKL